MEYIYNPKGVCSSKMIFDIEGEIVNNLTVIGGCPGNLLAIPLLIKGQKIDDIIGKLQGVKCGFKTSSCPDQIACALINYKNIKRN